MCWRRTGNFVRDFQLFFSHNQVQIDFAVGIVF